MNKPAGAMSPGERQIEVCRRLIRQRHLIGKACGSVIRATPGWDMLLTLYLARCEDQRIFLLALCAASGAPTATAHRKIMALVDHGLVERLDDAMDKRQVELRLSDEGAAMLDPLFEALRQLWIAPPHD